MVNLDVTDYQWDYNEKGEPGLYVSQDELRRWFRTRLDEVQIRYDVFCKLVNIDEDILRSWENGEFSLKQGAIDLMADAFDRLAAATGRLC